MTELSPEDISRARELAAEHIVKSRLFERTHISLLDNLTIPYSSRKIRDFVTAEVMADFALAYAAAENERLTKELTDSRKAHDKESACWQLLKEAAEAKCDRLKGALEDMLKMAKMLIRYTSEHPSITQGWHTRMDAAEAALRPEGE